MEDMVYYIFGAFLCLLFALFAGIWFVIFGVIIMVSIPLLYKLLGKFVKNENEQPNNQHNPDV